MFDSQSVIQTPIRRVDGVQQIVVRWPTDDEWIERSKGWIINIQRRGRGVSESSVESSKADHKLYEQIRIEDSPELDPDEAKILVEIIARCDIQGVQLQGDEGLVKMKVFPGVPVEHRLKIPTAAQVTQFNRTANRLIDLPHGQQQIRNNMRAGLDLWDKCRLETTGYANGVPALHREAAIKALVEACAREVEASKDEDF